MAGKGELAPGREDAQAIVGARIRRRADECGFGQIRPVRDGLHPLGRQAVGVEHDGNRVSLEGNRRKHVDLLKRKTGRGQFWGPPNVHSPSAALHIKYSLLAVRPCELVTTRALRHIMPLVSRLSSGVISPLLPVDGFSQRLMTPSSPSFRARFSVSVNSVQSLSLK